MIFTQKVKSCVHMAKQKAETLNN